LHSYHWNTRDQCDEYFTHGWSGAGQIGNPYLWDKPINNVHIREYDPVNGPGIATLFNFSECEGRSGVILSQEPGKIVEYGKRDLYK
jgi:hypothetical protein